MENVQPFSAVIMQNENFSSFWWSVSFAAKFCNTSFYHLLQAREQKEVLGFSVIWLSLCCEQDFQIGG